MRKRQRGFSLIEVMMVLAIFLIISAAVFELLNASQIRYTAERDFLESFQGARLAVDLMVRDIHNAGYPPPYTFAGNLGAPPTPATYPVPLVGPNCPPSLTWTDPSCAPAVLQTRFATGILGLDAAGNVSTTCVVNTTNPGLSTCAVPNPWRLVLELDIDPENPIPDPITLLVPQVEWVYYDLRAPVAPETTSTLFRTVSPKRLGVRIGFEEFELGPGDSVSFDAQTPHRLWTMGDEPAVAIWVVLNRRNDGRARRPA